MNMNNEITYVRFENKTTFQKKVLIEKCCNPEIVIEFIDEKDLKEKRKNYLNSF